MVWGPPMRASVFGSDLRGVAAVGLACLFFGYGFLLRVSPAVMVNELMREFAVGAALLGNLSAIYLYIYAAMQIPIGAMLDALGTRWLLAVACLTVAAGSYIFAGAETLGTAYIGRFLIGIGCAFSWPGLLAIVGQRFPTRFAMLGGIGQVAGMAGGVLAQAPLAAVVAASGWRATMASLALVGVVLAVCVALVTRDRRRPVVNAVRPATNIRGVLRNPQVWWAALFGLAMTGPLLAFAGLWGVPFIMTTYGVERTIAASSISLVFVGSAVGALFLGWCSDRMQRRKPVMLAGSVLCATMLMIVVYVPRMPLAVLSAAVFFLGVGSSSLLLAFAVGREHSQSVTAGRAIGIINMAVVGSGALFQPIIGILLDTQWNGRLLDGARVYSAENYRLAMLVLPVAAAAGILALWRIKETYCRQRPDGTSTA